MSKVWCKTMSRYIINSVGQLEGIRDTVMEFRRENFFTVIFVSCLCTDLGTAVDTITTSQPIRDSETIKSKSSLFKLGFFSPPNSSNRFVGIWVDKKSEPVVWVANKNKPLNDSSGIITVEDGNLVVLNGKNQLLWSSNVSNSVNNVTAQLLDTGNLVLSDNINGRIIWESFEEPTDTFLKEMKLISSTRTGPIIQLTSWRSPSDPSTGSFTFGIDALNIPEGVIWNNSRPYARTGPWNGQSFIGIPDMYSVYLDGFQLQVDDQANVVTFSYALLNNLIIFYVLTSLGSIEERYWDEAEEEWKVSFRSLETECDVYGHCGGFGKCDAQKKPICNCLRGFEPKNVEEWSRGNWSSGCVRKRALQCEMINKTGNVGRKDGFLKLQNMKLPYFAERSSVPVELCREACLNNCSCAAYAYVTGIGCMRWTGNLIDLNKFTTEGEDLYLRLPHSELGKFNAILYTLVIL